MGALIYNWLGHHGVDYPRYSVVRAEFDSVLESFLDFVDRESIGPVRMNQWEVTYVNHCPIGSGWEQLPDWEKILRLPPLRPDSSGGLVLDGFGAQWSFEIAPRRGRVHVQVQRGQSAAQTLPGADVLVMSLTARGAIDVNDQIRSLGNGLDLGHETIVRLFTDMTTDYAHGLWGKK